MIFVSSAAFAQTTTLKTSNLLLVLQQKNIGWKPSLFKSLAADKDNAKPFLAPDFYASQLGFFCKQEIKMDKITKIPFRFRLGSVEQCNWLEGKARRY